MEKYYNFIGFNPNKSSLLYTPDELTDFILKYFKTWKPETFFLSSKNEDFKRVLIYLKLTESTLDLIKMISHFEHYIGRISMISSLPSISWTVNKKSTNHLIHKVLENSLLGEVVEKNQDNIKMILRDLKLDNLI